MEDGSAHLQRGQLLVCLALAALETGVGGCQFTDPLLSLRLLGIAGAEGALDLCVCTGARERWSTHTNPQCYVIQLLCICSRLLTMLLVNNIFVYDHLKGASTVFHRIEASSKGKLASFRGRGEIDSTSKI